MIRMRMRAQDQLQAITDQFCNPGDVLLDCRTRIDHEEAIVLAEDIGVGAGAGHAARIRRRQPP